ncbi:proteasome assembly chaperone 3 isoform X2 [Clinocottus analis]|uniref:proteasome assembly chaperone 3 isoform X2 n=1 Tax=Clinocottus analis TaxID=304258 RepID=UPI0035C146DF
MTEHHNSLLKLLKVKRFCSEAAFRFSQTKRQRSTKCRRLSLSSDRNRRRKKSNDISTPAFTTKVLLGKDEPLTHVCAKNLATFVSQEAGNRPVLLGLALKDSSIDAIKQMKEIIKSCQVW